VRGKQARSKFRIGRSRARQPALRCTPTPPLHNHLKPRRQPTQPQPTAPANTLTLISSCTSVRRLRRKVAMSKAGSRERISRIARACSLSVCRLSTASCGGGKVPARETVDSVLLRNWELVNCGFADET
jgi:hypothetical protein